MGGFLIILSLLCAIAVFVLFVIFIIRAIMKRSKKWIGISAGICGFLVLPLMIAGGLLLPEVEPADDDVSLETNENAVTTAVGESDTVVSSATTVETTTATTATASETEEHTYVEVSSELRISSKEIVKTLECSLCGDTKTEKHNATDAEIIAYLKENCQMYSYEEIARYPDNHNGELTMFSGEVIQVSNSLFGTTLLVNITNNGLFWTDSVYVDYNPIDDAKVLEGDIITMYGKSTGETTYITVLNASRTVPSFTAYYIELGETGADGELKPVFDETTVISQIETTTYKLDNYAFIEIANNSEFDLDISIDLKYYNEAGELIGVGNGAQEAIQSGTTALFYDRSAENYASVEYEVSAKETMFKCITSDLEYEVVSANNKEIVTITNNSENTAKSVKCAILFFMGDQVVDHDYNYFVDDDFELKPGKSEARELDSYESYDSYKIYITAYNYAW